MRTLVPLLVASCVVLGAPALPQESATVRPQDDPSPLGTLFRRVFPQPTGRNGFEELVMAGEIAIRSKTLEAIVANPATLEGKRAALDDADLRRALALTRAGLAKPLRPPEVRSDDRQMLFPHFAALRALGRLLAVEQYVLLADGKVGQAIDSLRDGLRIGYAVQSQAIIGGLVGIAIDGIVIRAFAPHVDQLSARDCDRLVALATEWLKSPDPTVGALEFERREVPRMLEGQAEGQKLLGTPEWQKVLALQSMAFDRLIASVRLPAWERKPLPPLTGDSTAERAFAALWATLAPAYDRVQDSWTRDIAQIQLLGVHAAVRRYRWEHDRLPDSLDQLKLGPLAVDPFTGRTLSYRTTGPNTFQLTSEGPVARDDELKPIEGQRTPVELGKW